MYYQVKSYLKFLLKSTNQHGVHSPFVYDLITKCFYDKVIYPEYARLKAHRKKLIDSSEIIEVTDFGQGSRVFTSNRRKIPAIVKNAGIHPKRQQLLFRLVRYFEPQTILELGTSLGLATVAMSLGNREATINTVEGCKNTAAKAQLFFDELRLRNIKLHPITFEEYFSEKTNEKNQLVYIDGNHNKARTLQYFEILLRQVDNETVIIFDDIYWSPEMTSAWQEIIRHPKVVLSIDTFHWGFIFFRKELQKQHFTIRM